MQIGMLKRKELQSWQIKSQSGERSCEEMAVDQNWWHSSSLHLKADVGWPDRGTTDNEDFVQTRFVASHILFF